MHICLTRRMEILPCVLWAGREGAPISLRTTVNPGALPKASVSWPRLTVCRRLGVCVRLAHLELFSE